MSEQDTQAADGLSAGALLRQAREAAGLHVSTLAANLKVPVRKLEALEEDRFDLLPDAVFVRALAASVCRTLKIDPQPVLERLPQTPQPRLAHDRDGINAPFRPPGGAPRGGWFDQVSRPVGLTVVALLLAAVVLIFLPVTQREGASGPALAGPEPVMPPGTPATIEAAPAEPRGSDAVAPAASSPVVVAPAPLATAPAAPPAALLQATPALAAASVAAPSAALAAPAAPATGTVVFRTSGSSWIQVTDATGNQVLRRLMDAGETAGASGALPLTVTVGNMAATEVQVRGKPYNLGPTTRDNVARFEVK